MSLRSLLSLAALVTALPATPVVARSQDPLERYSDAFEAQVAPSQPAISYVVRVDPRDRSGYDVAMHVRNADDTLRLAMPVWAPGAYRVADFARYLRGLTVETGGRRLTPAPAGDSRWVVPVANGEATVRYRVAYPSPTAAETPNNRAFLRATGGLIDGPATFLYVEGEKLAPAHVRLELPDDWRVATGLVPTADRRTFFAPSYDVLIDAPILLGELREWTFLVDGVPHRVAYWPLPDATPFDTTAFVGSVRRIVEATREVFGPLPYRDYTFLYIDGAGGGLEHLNSTTIGAPSAALARDPEARTGVTAHEFVHTWNVKRVRPLELGPFDYQRPVRTTGLWFSEGVTDYYADVIERRGGLVTEAEARAGLEERLTSYLGNPARTRISPERSSWTAWDPPTVNDGYAISYYLQGALLGELLDLRLREATGMRRGMDDLMRLLDERHGGARGFTRDELLAAVNEVCACDLQPLFGRLVSGATPIDPEALLAPLGWRAVVERDTARDASGRARPDLRVSLIGYGGVGSAGGAAGELARLSVGNPESAWGRAGLRTGDQLVAVNGHPATSTAELRRALEGARPGDRVRVEVLRGGERRSFDVALTPYVETRVRIVDLPRPSEAQLAMRRYWLRGPEGTTSR